MAGSSVMADVGSAFGTQATAQSLGQRVGYFGLGVGVADYTSVVGTFDYGLSNYTTGRLKLGFTDSGDNADMALSMGAEVRWQIWQAGGVNKRPVAHSCVGAECIWNGRDEMYEPDASATVFFKPRR